MSAWEYVDFEVKVVRTNEKRYKVEVRSEFTGEAAGNFELGLTEREIGRMLEAITGAIRGDTRGVLRGGTAEREELKGYGKALFKALLGSPQVYAQYRSAMHAIWRDENKGVRIRLSIQPDELMELPWEYLYEGENGGHFLCVSSRTPIVRYIELPEPINPFALSSWPLRVLVASANPVDRDYTKLDVATERSLIERVLSRLKDFIEVRFVDNASYSLLQDELTEARTREKPFHIFHFIGHGEFIVEQRRGYLVLDDGRGGPALKSGEVIGSLLRDHPTLRLAVLNACHGARLAEENVFAGVATAIIRAGIPAVVAMQFPITDRMAIHFSERFYKSLVLRLPVDEAVGEARQQMYGMDEETVEFGTPVLYMRAKDGVIFNLSQLPEAEITLTPEVFIPRVVEPATSEVLERSLELEILGLAGIDAEIYLASDPYWEADPGRGYQEGERPGTYILNTSMPKGSSFKHFVVSEKGDRGRVAEALRNAGYHVTGGGDQSPEHVNKWRTWFTLREADGFSIRRDGEHINNVWL